MHFFTCILFAQNFILEKKVGVTYMFLGFLRQPIIEPLGKIPIFHFGNWEVCHEEVIALPCFGNGFTHKLIEAHPRISAVALLVNLSDESSQKFRRDVNHQKEWLIVGGSGPNKIFPVKTTHKHREADKSASTR
jgi:hypothetical protein